jgi:hypothetical protein
LTGEKKFSSLSKTNIPMAENKPAPGEDAIREAVIDAIKKGAITITIPIDKIRNVVDERADGVVKELHVYAKKLLEEARAVASATQTIEVKRGDKVELKKGLYHKDFSKVFSLVTARNPFNHFPVGLWLWGGAGAGKTHLAEQTAEQLGIKYRPIYGGPTMTETKLLGYRNAGNGEYVKGLTYDWYKEGGLLAIDEADLGESLSCMNSLFANSVYRFPDGEVIPRHPDTYFIALANTNGMGAKSGFRRSVQDVAALDRFNFWEFTYDWKLTRELCGQWPEFCDYVEQVHNWVKQQAKETNLHVTPRAALRGAALLHETDFDGEHISISAIFGLFPKDTKDACINNVGLFCRDTRSSKKGKSSKQPAKPYKTPEDDFADYMKGVVGYNPYQNLEANALGQLIKSEKAHTWKDGSWQPASQGIKY